MAHRSPEPRSGAVLAVLSLAAFMASLDVFIVNVAFDAIGRDFHGTPLSELSWVLNAYTIVYAALLVPAGRIADRFGRKGLFLIGLGLFTLASGACAAAGGIWWLVGFRALQAVGAAILTPASLGLIVASARPEHRARSVRIWAATGALAAALGPVIGGVLVEASWRWVFVVNLPVGVFALLAATRVVPRSRDDSVTRLPDLPGAALFAVAIGALTLGLVEGSDWGWAGDRIVAAWVVTLLALGGFLFRSSRHPEPVVAPSLVRVRTFAWSNVTAIMFSAPFGGVLLANILWMQQVWAYSPIKTGLGVAPGPLVVPVFTAIGYRLTRRVPVGRLVSLGCLMFAAGSVLVSLSVGVHPDYVGAVLPGSLIVGAGVGLSLPAILSSATADLPTTQGATGSAVINMSRQLGTVIGVAVLVAVLGTPVTYAVAHTAFRHGWWVLAAFAALGALSALGMTPRGGGDPAPDRVRQTDAASPRLVPESRK